MTATIEVQQSSDSKNPEFIDPVVSKSGAGEGGQPSSPNPTQEHTPGPWTYCEDDFAVLDASGNAVAEICLFDADGYLIAAAPDLLAALRKLIAQADSEPFSTVGHFVEHVAPRCRSAVAKAEGRS